MNALNTYEIVILDWIHENLVCPFLDFLMPAISLFGEAGIFWIAVAALLLISKKTRKLGLTLGLSFILGLAIGNGILKNVVGRIRPYDFNPIMRDWPLVHLYTDGSFPSGHTLVSAEAASVLMLRKRNPWGWLASVLCLLMMFSRMYLYVHYPLDVLGGLLFGTLFGWIAVKTADYLEPKLFELAARIAEKKKQKQ
ncbi:MAG: phosphatase PAP2 family protein [Lachnospiraceae bacterium]|nr:phosphatase PAP2 family protein [Lachnospiraceae bacterium]